MRQTTTPPRLRQEKHTETETFSRWRTTRLHRQFSAMAPSAPTGQHESATMRTYHCLRASASEGTAASVEAAISLK